MPAPESAPPPASLPTRKAIATLCIGPKAEQFARYSHPVFRAYAARVGADFVVFDAPKVKYPRPIKHFNPILFEKYQLYELLATYDRVLFVDTDILVTPHAPDIFARVPPDKVGGVFEDFGSTADDRRAKIRAVQARLGELGWERGFMNSGVFVVSRQHRAAFRYCFEYGCHDGEYEQTNTNWYLRKAGVEFHPLDYRFNYMGIMRVYYGPPHRRAYFIHYAGGGIFPHVPRLRQMREDHEYFYGPLPGEPPLADHVLPDESDAGELPDPGTDPA